MRGLNDSLNFIHVEPMESIRTVTSLAREKGEGSALSAELPLKINTRSNAIGVRSDTDECEPAVTQENLAIILDSACQWFSADSFRELHPVEQASIALLRLIDMHPFERTNERIALVAASLFTLRSGLPPIIVEPATQTAYRAAVDEGFRVNTKPMVEFVAASVETSLNRMIEEAGR